MMRAFNISSEIEDIIEFGPFYLQPTIVFLSLIRLEKLLGIGSRYKTDDHPIICSSPINRVTSQASGDAVLVLEILLS